MAKIHLGAFGQFTRRYSYHAGANRDKFWGLQKISSLTHLPTYTEVSRSPLVRCLIECPKEFIFVKNFFDLLTNNYIAAIDAAKSDLENLEVLGLVEVSIPDEVSDWEEDEEGSDVETPEEQPVDLMVEYLRVTSKSNIC